MISNDEFFKAAEDGNLAVIKQYLSQDGADINKTDENGYTVLHHAAQFDHFETVKYLVLKNININQATNITHEGCLALHLAAKNDNLEIVKYLVEEAKANINKTTKCNNWTALHYVAMGGYLKLVKYLLEEKQANIHLPDKSKSTALHHAAINGHVEIIAYFLEDRKIRFIHEDCIKALNLAAENDHLEVIKYLLEQGYNINQSISDKDNPLYPIKNSIQLGDYLYEAKVLPTKQINQLSIQNIELLISRFHYRSVNEGLIPGLPGMISQSELSNEFKEQLNKAVAKFNQQQAQLANKIADDLAILVSKRFGHEFGLAEGEVIPPYLEIIRLVDEDKFDTKQLQQHLAVYQSEPYSNYQPANFLSFMLDSDHQTKAIELLIVDKKHGQNIIDICSKTTLDKDILTKFRKFKQQYQIELDRPQSEKSNNNKHKLKEIESQAEQPYAKRIRQTELSPGRLQTNYR